MPQYYPVFISGYFPVIILIFYLIGTRIKTFHNAAILLIGNLPNTFYLVPIYRTY